MKAHIIKHMLFHFQNLWNLWSSRALYI